MPTSLKDGARSKSSRQSGHRYFRISNLRKDTIAATVSDYFQKFGKLEWVKLELNDNDAPRGTALVLYRDKPEIQGFHKEPTTIDGSRITIEPVPYEKPLSEYHGGNRTRVQAARLSLGVMVEPRTFVEEWATENDVAMISNYDRRRIQIYFIARDEKYRLEFSFKDMTNGDMIMERNGNTTFFTIQLKYPARYWRQHVNAKDETKTTVTFGDRWERIVTIPPPSAEKKGSDERKPVLPMSEQGTARLGMWTTYRLKFTPRGRGEQQFAEMLKIAGEYNLVPRDTRMILPELSVKKASDFKNVLNHEGRAKILSFEVLYMLEALILSQQICEYNLDDHFYNTIKEINPDILVGIFNILAMSKKRIWDPLGAITQIFNEQGVKVSHRRKIPPNSVMMCKIIVTPTTMYINPPQVEMTNRVVRHFAEHANRFARIQFVDDGMRRVSASHEKRENEAVYNRIYSVMKNGLQIGARRYDFLAFSSAQLRDHGCWFFAPTADLNTTQIRAWMGKFTEEKVIAKHAVRMGQCFSSTRPITRLRLDEVKIIDDVIHNDYTFSDGVGNISRTLAQEVAISMDSKTIPSAFQFRFGGAKGVLTVSNVLQGRKIELRPSQIKFESDHSTLEIIRVSTLIPSYLNRQAITLLSTLGVPDAVFMRKFEKIKNSINKMLDDPNTAIRTLTENVDEFGTALSMIRIIQAGFLEKRDPYILNLLNMFRSSMLKDLKKKAKILVPEGAFLLGVMDETKTLGEGQVFCQISMADGKGSSTKVIEGEVVVFRNPCFHPGDIRVVQAVNSPKLKHLCDVLVFSSQGYRDIPSMCSGGDLDGDDYTIFWDRELIPPKKNYEPMNYKAPKPPEVVDVRISDIKKFFVNYINNDNLGQIANAHLATADASPNGALDGNCLRLAQLHSLAVDFPKSGRPAKFESNLRVKKFPDFMQKKDKEMYESSKILGQIYRGIDKSDYKDYKDQIVDNTLYDVRLRVEGIERYVAEARVLKAEYDKDVFALMNQYGVQTEAELLSGYVVKWLKKGSRKSTHELQKQTMAAVEALKNKWKKRFEAEFIQDGPNSDQTAALEAKASAWYYVTYHADEQCRNLTLEGKALSFPWVIYEHICDIAQKNNNCVAREDRARPVDDELVQKYAQQTKGKQPFKYSVIYENEALSEDDDDGEEEEEEEDVVTEVLSLDYLPLQQQQQHHVTRNEVGDAANHLLISANATEEDLANALLS